MKSDSPALLIVDDNEDNRYTLQMLLETDGHERIVSASGGAAITTCQYRRELLIEVPVAWLKPSERLDEIIANVDRLSPDHVYRHRMYPLLVSFRRNENLGYLLDGFRLAQRYQVSAHTMLLRITSGLSDL